MERSSNELLPSGNKCYREADTQETALRVPGRAERPGLSRASHTSPYLLLEIFLYRFIEIASYCFTHVPGGFNDLIL